MLDSAQLLSSLAEAANAFIINGTVIMGVNRSVAGEIVIPDGITEIAKGAFRKQPITHIVFPSSLRVIGEEAFDSCVELLSFTFAGKSQLTTIMDRAFYSCIELSEFVIPGTAQFIGRQAFAFCAQSDPAAGIKRSIHDLVIPEGAYVYEKCFDHTNIDLLHIKADIIIPYSFSNANVFRVSWESGSRIIPEHAFAYCMSLCEFIFSDTTNIEVIAAGAFECCTDLFSMQVPDGVRAIHQRAFADSGLQYFKAPKSLKVIGDFALANTPCLSIDLDDSDLEVIGDCAFADTQITSLVVRGTIKVLDYGIVAGCKQLVSLRIGPSVEYFMDRQRQSLKSVQKGYVKFDMAIILEGVDTKCENSVIAPIIFLPYGACMPNCNPKLEDYLQDISKELHRTDGLADAYGRYAKSARSFIYY